MMRQIHFILISLLAWGTSAQLPTLYEYYTADGISSGLSADQTYFTLNGKNITILSGSLHYFRVPPQYWRDRLRKLRALGLNTVETSIAWNLHEPESGRFDFGAGGTDFEQFLDLQQYLQIAQEEDLFAIVRPGPYICAEWEWGGFPSWLLREDGIRVRSSDPVFMNYVQRYFEQLFPILNGMQFSKGGPIIAVQVENEYGYAPTKDLTYIQQLYDLFQSLGIVELLVTSDGATSGTSGTIPELLLQTLNFGTNPVENLDQLKEMQPNRPVMVMEYWTGWFDRWSENHHIVDNTTFHLDYEAILSYPASVSMYLFHGGTNFGFLNGANNQEGDNTNFAPITTSYDYDAPLSEAGDYTSKYQVVKELLEQYNPVQTLTPAQPELIPRVVYPSMGIEGQLNFEDILVRIPDAITSETPLSMEQLPINGNSGQSYGYTIYRRSNLNILAGSVLTITGHVRDTVMVLINGVLVSKPLTSSEDLNGFGYYRLANSNLTLTSTDLEGVTLDLIIENWGRVNFGELYSQFKGLIDGNTVYINNEELTTWTIIPMEFKTSWNTQLTGWKPFDGTNVGPSLYRTVFTLDEDPSDTYVNMEEWTKGIVIVNGFVLGRYAFIGPQQTLYLPGPFLRPGDNEIVIFEQFNPATEIKFSENPIFKTV